uniref:Synaptonemal complex protein 1 n=1 Tax=Anthurium amnicola TaxID=1678845 RepID=A0A1D1XL76_9ARAE
MQKPAFLGMKSLDQLRSIRGPTVGPAKAMPMVNLRTSTDSISLGAFANLKLTAEKLVKEQASVKTDLEMANSKLKKSAEQIHLLEVKLQEAINENAKLKVKHKEDAKLWNGLDSKLSSTKMLCDQLTETLQHLASRTRDAEKDKKFFEEKLLESSKAFDGLGCQLNDLSAKLDNAENTIRNGKHEMMTLENEKKEIENNFKEQCCVSNNLMKERAAIANQLEDTVKADEVHLQSLVSQMEELRHGLESKETMCESFRRTIENLEGERNALRVSNEDFSSQLLRSSKETKSLEDALLGFLKQVEEMDKHSLTVSNNAMQLFSSFETFDTLIQQEKGLVVKNAQTKFDRLHDHFQTVSSENDSFKSEVETLKNKIVELQKAQEFLMVQHAEECHLVEEKVRKLESETDFLVSKKNELELLVTQLEEKNSHLSKAQSLADSQLKDFLMKASKLESENQDIKNKMQLMLLEKSEQINNLQNEIAKHKQHIVSLEDQSSEFRRVLDEKDQHNLQFCEREKLLEEQKSEIQASLALAESRLTEARKQYDLMLETKQLELSKHLKEISQRNDQAINDIRRKYEMEKLEIVNMEKEKLDKLVKDMERKCTEKLAEHKEEAQRHLVHIQEEHDALINQINQEYDRKESKLRDFHNEELQRIQLQAENELREKMSFMRKEHEIQMQVLRHQHEDECGKLQEELDILKSKEEKQRALLQLQWKVMDEKSQQNDVEVSSKKEEYSVSSMKMRDMNIGNRSQLVLTGPDNGRKEKFSGIMRTPVAKMMKKTDKGNKGNAVNIPKHSKKVTHHEYEIETSNGRTITKRRKTKSTVMFGDPTSHKRANLKTPKAVEDATKLNKVQKGTHPHPSNIGDLFSEGSLNPYTDDPYAFD